MSSWHWWSWIWGENQRWPRLRRRAQALEVRFFGNHGKLARNTGTIVGKCEENMGNSWEMEVDIGESMKIPYQWGFIANRWENQLISAINRGFWSKPHVIESKFRMNTWEAIGSSPRTWEAEILPWCQAKRIELGWEQLEQSCYGLRVIDWINPGKRWMGWIWPNGSRFDFRTSTVAATSSGKMDHWWFRQMGEPQ